MMINRPFRGWWRTHVISDTEGQPYLTRRYLLGHSESNWGALMLHHMHRPDADRCHHDHPWPFTTLVLWGGYEEEVTGLDHTFYNVKVRVNRPGTIRRNSAVHTHRISRLLGNCYTLVWRGPKERSWGFRSRLGRWIWWREFDKKNGPQRVLWCNDEQEG